MKFFFRPDPLFFCAVQYQCLFRARRRSASHVRGILITSILAMGLSPALAEAMDYGFALGPGLTLYPSPVGSPGVAGGLAAVMNHSTSEVSAPFLRYRGEVQGFISEQSKAALPTLTADFGYQVGVLDVFFTGGVELFGVAWQGEYTLFSTLGFVGGAGLSLTIHPSARLGLRSVVTYLPSVTSAVMDGPENGSSPSVALLSIFLCLEVASGQPEPL